MKKSQTNTVRDCSFTGVHWDAKAVDAITTIAGGLLENARGLHALAGVLSSQRVTLGPMLQIGTAPQPGAAAVFERK